MIPNDQHYGHVTFILFSKSNLNNLHSSRPFEAFANNVVKAVKENRLAMLSTVNSISLTVKVSNVVIAMK